LDLKLLLSFVIGYWNLTTEEFMKVQPLADRVVVKKVEAEAKTSSGLLLPESAKEKPQAGMVQAVGKDVKEVQVGDQVLYAKYGPTEVVVDGEELLLLKEEDVLAVIK
jgi:chaperonin GroES